MGANDESVIVNNAKEIEPVFSVTSGKKLWNPKGFIILSVLFSFLPAGILYSLNYGRLGFSKKRNISLVAALAGFAIMITMSIMISQSILKSIFYGLNLGAAAYMYRDQSKLFENHVQNGGRKASYLIPAIISIIITAALLAVVFYLANIPDQKMMFNCSELYYTENVQKDDAQKLGNYLIEQGFFVEGKKISVKIDKKSETYEFSFVVNKSSLQDSNFEQTCKDFSADLSKNVFNNCKVDINLCDNTFKPLKTISN